MIKRKQVWSGCGERCQRCGRVIPNGVVALCESGRRWTHETACGSQAVSVAEYATERQVAYAVSLQGSYWTPAVFGGRRYDRAELSGMSKADVSRIIDALVNERELQGAY